MRRTIGKTLPCLALIATSCICFERQTLVFRYDDTKDQLRIFQLYEGIHGDSGGDTIDEKEKEELESVLNGQRTFFFNNWITEYDGPTMEKLVAEAASAPEGTEADPKTAAARKEELALMKLLLASVKVTNGRFFLNAQGKLSAYQFVTMDHASKVVARANRLISQAIETEMGQTEDEDELSEESRRRLIDAAGKGYAWITLERNCIHLRFPLAYADLKRVREDKARSLLESLAGAASGGDRLQALVRNVALLLESDVWVSYTGGTLEITLGHPSCARPRLQGEPFDSSYKPNAVAFAREHGGLADAVDVQKLMDDFFKEASE